MALFILLTRLVSEEVRPSFAVQRKERLVMDEIERACPEIKWVANYVMPGPYDYLDILEAPNTETVMKLSSIIRSIAGAHTEIWPAVTWQQHKSLMREVADHIDMPGADVILAR